MSDLRVLKCRRVRLRSGDPESVRKPSEFTGNGPQGFFCERKSKKAEKTWKNHEKMIDTHGTVYYNNRV